MSPPPVAENLDVDNEHRVNLDQDPRSLSDSPRETPSIPGKQPSPYSKPCTLCNRPRDVLIRCQIDETRKWHFVCTGKCWQQVSGGSADGDLEHPLYRYGGMWKNKHEAVSAKIKGKAKEKNKGLWNGTPGPHRRRGIKAWSKRVGKGTGLQGDAKVMEGDGGSDISVSDLSESESEEEVLYDEIKKEEGKERPGKEEFVGSQV